MSEPVPLMNVVSFPADPFLKISSVKLNSLPANNVETVIVTEFDAYVDDLASSIGTLVRRLRFETAEHELSLTQRAVLARLAREGERTISDLARAEGMKPQSMSTTVANLEELGMVERRAHPTDGRQTNIVLTREGQIVQSEMRAARRSWLGDQVAQLTAAQQKTLFEAAKIMRQMGDQ